MHQSNSLTRLQSAKALDGAGISRVESQRLLEALGGIFVVPDSQIRVSQTVEDRCGLLWKHLRVQLENLQRFLVLSMLQKLPAYQIELPGAERISIWLMLFQLLVLAKSSLQSLLADGVVNHGSNRLLALRCLEVPPIKIGVLCGDAQFDFYLVADRVVPEGRTDHREVLPLQLKPPLKTDAGVLPRVWRLMLPPHYRNDDIARHVADRERPGHDVVGALP